MTAAALAVLSAKDSNFWLMVEAGDVDWAMHDNNIDNAIGAILSGQQPGQPDWYPFAMPALGVAGALLGGWMLTRGAERQVMADA